MNAIVDGPVHELHDPIGRNPFFRLIGLEVLEAAHGHSRFRLEENPDTKNVFNVAHGGVVMTLLDAAMASAAMSRVDFQKVVVTIDMSISFIGPGTGRLYALGHATGGGNSVCFCDGEIVTEDGTVVAKAIGSFRYRERRAHGQ